MLASGVMLLKPGHDGLWDPPGAFPGMSLPIELCVKAPTLSSVPHHSSPGL